MSEIKKAKYRVKNAEGGYDVVYLETSTDQVEGLQEFVAEQIVDKADSVHGHMAEEMEFDVDMVTVNSLGGIGAGEDLDGLSVNQVLKKLLYPHVNHSISGTSNPNGGTFEYGDTKTVTSITANVTKKSNPITSIEVFDGSTSLGVKTEGISNGGSHAFTVNVPVSTNGKSFQVKATANGANGQPLTLAANTGTFTFVYPYFHGVVAADKASLTGDEIKAMTKAIEGKGNKQRTYNVNNERMVFAYPKSYGVLKTIIDPNGFDNFGSFVRSEVVIKGLDGTDQTYYVYINGASTNSNFVMKFNY